MSVNRSVLGGAGGAVLHALAPDGEPDLLNCGPGHDRAFVLRSSARARRSSAARSSSSSTPRPPIRTRARTRMPTRRPTPDGPNPVDLRSPLAYRTVTTLRPPSAAGAATIVLPD